MSRSSLTDTVRLWRRSAWPTTRLIGLCLVGASVVFLIGGLAVTLLFRAEAGLLVKRGEVTWAGTKLMALEGSIVTAILVTFVLSIASAAAIALCEGVRAEVPFGARNALRRGLQCWTHVVAASAYALATTAALAIISPVFVTLGVLGLLSTPLVRRIQRRRASFRWPTVRHLILLAVPFALAARQLLRGLLIVPSAVDRPASPRAVFANSAARVAGRRRTVVVGVGVALLAAFVVQYLLYLLATSFDIGLQYRIAAATVVMWPLLIALWSSTLTHLYHAGGSDVGDQRQMAFLTDPVAEAWVRRRRAIAPGLVTAMLAGTLAIAPFQYLPASTALAAASFTVNSGGDESDALPGDGVCDTGTGVCTLRAAIEESNVAPSGTTAITITVGSITLTSTLLIRSDVSIIGSGVLIDANGHQAMYFGAPLGGETAPSPPAPTVPATVGLDTTPPTDAPKGVPETTVPATTVPATTVPVTTVPAVTEPPTGTTQPSPTTAPQTSVPQTSVPQTSVPETTVPETTAPATTAPEMTAPATTVPADTAAATEIAPQGFAPHAAVRHAAVQHAAVGEPISGHFSLSNMTIENGSSSGDGGAILTSFSGDISTVDFVGNSAGSFGGAIATHGALSITNSTFSHNSASEGGADVAAYTDVTILNSTFVDGSGGSLYAFNGASVTLTNTIVERGQGGIACTGISFGGSNDAVQDDSCSGVGTSVSDLGLGTFGNHGGSVRTVDLLGEPYVDGGLDGSCPSVDARGQTRPKGSHCDIGAYEFDPATTTTVSATPSPSNFGDAIVIAVGVHALHEATAPAGGLQFFVDGAAIPFASGTTDAGGNGTATISTLGQGTHTIRADWDGGTTGLSPSSGTTTVIVDGAASPLTVTSSLNPSIVGDNVTFTATIDSGGSPTPTGTITIVDGSTVLVTANVADGSVTYNATGLDIGTHQITAVYSGDSTYQPSTSAALAQVVRAHTALAVTPSSSTAIYGTPIVFGYVVSSPETTPPDSGEVVLTDTNAVILRSQLDGAGHATATRSDLAPGTWTLTAQYTGSTAYAASAAQHTTVTITTSHPTIALGAAPAATSSFGQPVGLLAKLTAADTSALPMGTVEFFDGSASLGTVTVDAFGAAVLPINTLSTATHQLKAVFTGGIGFADVTSSALPYTVAPAVTAIALQTSPSTSVSGQVVTLHATVTASASMVSPGGTVTFSEGAATLGMAILDAAGSATITVATFAVGGHAISASYSGNTNFTPSTSPVAAQSVIRAGTSVTLSANPAAPTFGANVTLTAALVAVAPGFGNPTGTVSFVEVVTSGATTTETPLGTRTLDGAGLASVTVTAPAAGQHVYRVVFGGDTSFGAGSAQVVVGTGLQPATLTLAADPTTVEYGQSIVLTITINSATVPSSASSIMIQIGARPIASLPVTGRTMTFTIAGADSPDVGPNNIEVWLDSSDYRYATTSITESVVKVTPTAVLSFAPSAVVANHPNTLTATVTGYPGTLATGTVTFFVDDARVGEGSLDSNGVAVTQYTFANGFHGVRIAYNGDNRNNFISTVHTDVDLPLFTPAIALSQAPSNATLGAPAAIDARLAGVADQADPTGTVTFSEGSTTLGTVTLAPWFEGGTIAVVTSSALSLGDHIITAAYSGDGVYIANTLTYSLTIRPAPTVITITSSSPDVAVGATVTYTVVLKRAFATGVPVGQLDLRIDGSLERSERVADAASATVTFTHTYLLAGAHTVSAGFSPSTVNDLGAAGSLDQFVGRAASKVTTSGSKSSAAVGESVSFTADVAASAGSSTATGKVTISDGVGASCITSAPHGVCSLTWSTTGKKSVTATYAGDTTVAASTSPGFTVTVNQASPTITASTAPVIWVVGEVLEVSWTVNGPTSGTVTVKSPNGAQLCSAVVTAKSCRGTFAASMTSPLTVAYSGDGQWLAARTVVNGVIKTCQFVPVTVQSTERGTVTVTPAPNCLSGTGYLQGTSLTVTPTANTGYTVGTFTPTADGRAGLTGYVFVVDGKRVGANGINVDFVYDCVSLTVTIIGPGNLEATTDTSGSRECTQPGGGTLASTILSYVRGTVVNLHPLGQKYTVDAAGTRTPSKYPAVLVAVRGATAQQPLGSDDNRVTATLDRDTTVTFGFDAPCFTIGLNTSGGAGTANASTSTNCTNILGVNGYRPDTAVTLGASAVGNATFKAWQVAGAPVAGFDTTKAPVTFPISRSADVTAVFTTCHKLTVGVSGFAEDGTVSAVTAANCASGTPGYYVDGTDVQVAWRSYEFTGWAKDQPSSEVPDTDPWSQTVVFHMDADVDAIAKFTRPSYCGKLAMTTEPKTGGTVVVSGVDSDYPCPAGQYALGTAVVDEPTDCYKTYTQDQNEDAFLHCGVKPPQYNTGKTTRLPLPRLATFTATPTSGNPLIGFAVSTGSPPWAGLKVNELYGIDGLDADSASDNSGSTDIYGDTEVTAYFCQRVLVNPLAVAPDGTALNAGDSSAAIDASFIALSPEPNCPLDPNAYIVGTTVTAKFIGSPSGFTFSHWEGAATGTGLSTSFVVDGATHDTRISALTTLICHRLSAGQQSGAQSPITIATAPNCPHTGQDGDWYVGGTVVAMSTGYPSNADFIGWIGNVDAGSNRTAFVTMDTDQTVSVNFHIRSDVEQAIYKAGQAINSAVDAVKNYATNDLPAAAKIVTAMMAKGAQYGLAGIFNEKFGLLGLPLTGLTLLNLALNDDKLGSVIKEYTNILGAANIASVMIGCTADSALGINGTADGHIGPNLDSGTTAFGTMPVGETANQAATALAESGTKLQRAKLLFPAITVVANVATVANLGFQVGQSFANGDFALSGTKLQDRIKNCLLDAMPTHMFDLAASVGNSVLGTQDRTLTTATPPPALQFTDPKTGSPYGPNRLFEVAGVWYHTCATKTLPFLINCDTVDP